MSEMSVVGCSLSVAIKNAFLKQKKVEVFFTEYEYSKKTN